MLVKVSIVHSSKFQSLSFKFTALELKYRSVESAAGHDLLKFSFRKALGSAALSAGQNIGHDFFRAAQLQAQGIARADV